MRIKIVNIPIPALPLPILPFILFIPFPNLSFYPPFGIRRPGGGGDLNVPSCSVPPCSVLLSSLPAVTVSSRPAYPTRPIRLFSQVSSSLTQNFLLLPLLALPRYPIKSLPSRIRICQNCSSDSPSLSGVIDSPPIYVYGDNACDRTCLH